MEESLLLIALPSILWRLSYHDMHDWRVARPALATACGLPLGADGRLRVARPVLDGHTRHSGRSDLLRSPKRVLAHSWEGLA